MCIRDRPLIQTFDCSPTSISVGGTTHCTFSVVNKVTSWRIDLDPTNPGLGSVLGSGSLLSANLRYNVIGDWAPQLTVFGPGGSDSQPLSYLIHAN